MGFVTGTIRLLYLTQLRNDLEHKIMLISEAKLDMSKSITELISVGTDLDSDSPIVKNMKARRDKMKLIEQELDQKMEQYKIKLQAVDREIQSAQAIVDKGINSSFAYGGGR